MSKSNLENSPYITTANIYGIWRVNRMEYDSRNDAYSVTLSKSLGNASHESAVREAVEWAKREGLEYRP